VRQRSGISKGGDDKHPSARHSGGYWHVLVVIPFMKAIFYNRIESKEAVWEHHLASSSGTKKANWTETMVGLKSYPSESVGGVTVTGCTRQSHSSCIGHDFLDIDRAPRQSLPILEIEAARSDKDIEMVCEAPATL
jgi:hypothetical protein